MTQEGELPQILMRHGEEVRALKEQLRRSQESSSSYHRKLNDLRRELLRLTDRKKKLEEVVKKRHLLERETLTLQLQEANEKMEAKEKQFAVRGKWLPEVIDPSQYLECTKNTRNTFSIV